MNLFVAIDASADQVPETFALPQGSVVQFFDSAKLPDSHGIPPRIYVNVLEGQGIVESLGSFNHGEIRPDHLHPNHYSAHPPIPSTGSGLVHARAVGTATLELVATTGDKAETTTFHLTVTPSADITEAPVG